MTAIRRNAWYGNPPPGAGDELKIAWFDEPPAHILWNAMTGNTTSDSIFMNARSAILQSEGGPYTHTVDRVSMFIELALGVPQPKFLRVQDHRLVFNERMTIPYGATLQVWGGTVDGAGDMSLGGEWGTSYMSIDYGGSLTNANATVNWEKDGAGNRLINVRGGSSWTSTSELAIATSDNGSLSVWEGGSVFSNTGVIARDAGSTGTVWLEDSGAQWTNTQGLTIGSGGVATLYVEPSADVASGSGIIGELATSTGYVYVQGSGASWTTDAETHVGVAGNGTLEVTGGATAHSGSGEIGGWVGSTGQVTVRDTGSSWDVDSELFVGKGGSGILWIDNDASVTNVRGVIGTYSNSSGLVTVSGQGSQWNNSDFLHVGYGGTGTLEVYSGRNVTSNLTLIASRSGSSGIATISGSGSQLSAVGTIHVGWLGNGELNIESGGFATSRTGIVGNDTGSQGLANVTGQDSRWSTSNMEVGSLGPGELNIQSGGVVEASQSMEVNSSGEVTVDGSSSRLTVNAPSPWAMDGVLNINNSAVLNGTGQMNVTGRVNVQSGTITSRVEFQPGSSVVIDSGNSLRLDGTTNYIGGAYRGGILYQNGTANVLADTTLGNNLIVYPPAVGPPNALLWLEQFDWDGTGGAGKVTNISPNATLTVNAEKIDSSPGTDGYDGTVNINGGTLIVNTGDRLYNPVGVGSLPVGIAPASWRLDGVMNLTQFGTNTAVVTSQYGSPMHIYGEVNALAGAASIVGITPTLATGGLISVANGATLTVNNGLVAQGTIDVQELGFIRINGGTFEPSARMAVHGTVELDGNSTFGGGTYAGVGTVRLVGDAGFNATTLFDVQVEFAAGGTNTIASGKAVQLAGDAVVEAGAVFQGSGGVRILSGSVVTLVDGADVGVALLNDGALAIGDSPGSASIDQYTQASTGKLRIEISGASTGEFDQLNVGGTAILDGLLSVELLSNFLPDAADVFTILTGSLNGTFSNAEDGDRLDTIDGWGSFRVSYLERSRQVRLSQFLLAPSLLPGDYNADGVVDAADYSVWRDNLGAPAGTLDNDVDGGVIGVAQYDTWKAHFGEILAPAALQAAAAVPEPSTISIVVIGMFAIAFRSRRTSSICPSLATERLQQ